MPYPTRSEPGSKADMPLALVNGVKLNVEVVGRGPHVVAVHGFTGNLATWECLAEAGKEEFTFVLVDVLGHGESDAPSDPARYSMDNFMDDLIAVLDSLGVERANWLGYSMGGRICLYLALTMPERCDALVLEGESPGIADASERKERATSDYGLSRMIEEKGIEAFVDYWEALPLFSSQKRLPQQARQKIREQRLGNSPIGLANSLRGMSTGMQPPLHDRLTELDLPALFIAGEEDSKYCDIARWMSAETPKGEVAVIPEAGHAAHLEQPDRFNNLVLDFLRANRGGR